MSRMNAPWFDGAAASPESAPSLNAVLLPRLAADASKRSRAEFLAQAPWPCLLTVASLERSLLERTLVLSLVKATAASNNPRIAIGEFDEPLLEDATLLPHTICLGRTPGNDIVIPAPRVSGRHACFTRRSGVWTITDLKSSNGTRVGGRAIPPNRAVRIRSPLAAIEFADVRFFFFLPQELYEFLRRAAEILSLVHAKDRVRDIDRSDPVDLADFQGLLDAPGADDELPADQTYVSREPASKGDSRRIDEALKVLADMQPQLERVELDFRGGQPSRTVYQKDRATTLPAALAAIRGVPGGVRTIRIALTIGDRRPFEIYTADE